MPPRLPLVSSFQPALRRWKHSCRHPGLPWNRAADNFSIGCVIAELYLSRRLFDNDMQTDREFLAAVERLLGPYSREFAEKIEAKHSGVFSFHNGTVSLLYPPAGSVLSTSDYAESMRRLERIRPLAVSCVSCYSMRVPSHIEICRHKSMTHRCMIYFAS